MKKILSVILAIVMAFSVGIVAFAEDPQVRPLVECITLCELDDYFLDYGDEAEFEMELNEFDDAYDIKKITVEFARVYDGNYIDFDDYDELDTKTIDFEYEDGTYVGTFKVDHSVKSGSYVGTIVTIIYDDENDDPNRKRYFNGYYFDQTYADDDMEDEKNNYSYQGRPEVVKHEEDYNEDDTPCDVGFEKMFGDLILDVYKIGDRDVEADDGEILIDSYGNGRSWCNWRFNAPAGATVTLYCDPDDGWEFVEWKVSGNNVTIDDNNTFKMPENGDGVVITGVYEDETKIKREIDVYSSGRGKASANVSKGVMGTKVKLTATPSEGYELKEWKVVYGDVKIEDNAFEIGSEDVRVKAVFKKAEAKVEEEVQEGTTETEENPSTGAPVMGNVVALAMVATVATVCTKRYF